MRFAFGLFALALTLLPQANAAQNVVGRASCIPDEQLRERATRDAMMQCQSSVVRQSEWAETEAYCYGPGHVEWTGMKIEAIFSCLPPGETHEMRTSL